MAASVIDAPTGSGSLPEPVSTYLAALQAERGASRHTLSAYRRDLADFATFLGRRRSLLAVTPDDVIAYLAALRRRGLRASSVARRLSSLGGLFRHLVGEGALARDPTEHIERPRLPRPLPRTLSRDLAAALVEAPDFARMRGLRDRAMLEVLYATGMRASRSEERRVGKECRL